MSLIPLLFSAPRHRHHRHNDDFALAIPFGYNNPSYDLMDPFNEVNTALGEMDAAMRFLNREMGRLSNTPSGQFNLNALMPDVVDENGQKKIQYNFDVRGFKPEDISLKTQDGRLVVSAKHQEGGDDHQMVREFHRMVNIPEGVKLEDLKSRLERGGVLKVEAPYNPPAIEQRKEEFREIPITHEKPKAVTNQPSKNNNEQSKN